MFWHLLPSLRFYGSIFLAILAQLPSLCWPQFFSICDSTSTSTVNYVSVPLPQCPASPRCLTYWSGQPQALCIVVPRSPDALYSSVHRPEVCAELKNVLRPWVLTKKLYTCMLQIRWGHLTCANNLHKWSFIQTFVSSFLSFLLAWLLSFYPGVCL